MDDLNPDTMTAERAAELTSYCEIQWCHTEMGTSYFQALKWCNVIGSNVVGNGPTVLLAVIQAHQKDRYERTKAGW